MLQCQRRENCAILFTRDILFFFSLTPFRTILLIAIWFAFLYRSLLRPQFIWYITNDNKTWKNSLRVYSINEYLVPRPSREKESDCDFCRPVFVPNNLCISCIFRMFLFVCFQKRSVNEERQERFTRSIRTQI